MALIHLEQAMAMSTYETSAIVEDQREVRVPDVPFEPGTEVEVTISPKRRPVEEFTAAWQRLCAELRAVPGMDTISEEEIRAEVDRYRAGQ